MDQPTDAGSRLHLHFAERLGSPSDAVRTWCEHLVFRAGNGLTIAELHRRLNNGVDLPFAIAVEEAEIRQAVAEGERRGHFVRAGPERFQLAEERRDTLLNSAVASEALLDRVRAKWWAELRERHGDLPDAVLHEAWDALEAFVASVVRDLCRNGDRSDDASDTGLPSADHPLRMLAEIEFPRFLTSEDPDYGEFFRRFLAHALYAYRTSVSREAADALRENLRGRVLYLDTNVLLPALGLTGDDQFEEGVLGVLELARAAGLRLHVTSRTIEEFETALDALRRRAQSNAAPDFAWRRQTPSLDRAMHRASSKSYMSVAEFVGKYADLRWVLSQPDLNRCDLREEGVGSDEMAAIMADDSYEQAIAAIRSTSTKEQKRLEHDAFHLALIAHRRTRDVWREARGWFLTLDRSLISANRRMGRRVPLAMSVDEWVLTFRHVLPRVDDFEGFVAAIVTRQVFPGFYLDQDRVNLFGRIAASGATRAANEVLARLAESLPSQYIPTGEGGVETDAAQALVDALEEMDERFKADRERVATYAVHQAKQEVATARSAATSAASAEAAARQRAEHAEEDLAALKRRFRLHEIADELEGVDRDVRGYQRVLDEGEHRRRVRAIGAVALLALVSFFALPRFWPGLTMLNAFFIVIGVAPFVVGFTLYQVRRRWTPIQREHEVALAAASQRSRDLQEEREGLSKNA